MTEVSVTRWYILYFLSSRYESNSFVKREKKILSSRHLPFLPFHILHSPTTHTSPLSGSIFYPPCSELLPPEFLSKLPALNMPARVFSLPPRLLLPYHRILVQMLSHETNQRKSLGSNRQLLLLLPCKCIALSSNCFIPHNCSEPSLRT